MKQTLENKYDVFICGGGIAGLVTAYALGKMGKKILLVEKKSEFNANGADVLKPAGIEVLERLGLFDSLLIHGAIKRDRVLFFYGGNFIAEMDYRQEHVRKYFMLIPYKNVLHMLLDRIKEIPNIHMVFNTELTTASVDKDSGNITSVMLNGDTPVQAKVYIAADGIMSRFREILSVPAIIEKYAQQMYFAQFPMVDSVAFCNRIYVDKRSSLAYFYPVGKDSFRCVIGFDKEEGEALFVRNKDVGVLKDRLYRFVTESTDAVEAITSLDGFVTFPLCRMNLDSYYKGNTVFLGNAAHSIHPITGQGMNLAIEDAGALYPLLLKHLDGSLELSQAFAKYQDIRHRVNTKLINYGHKLVNSFDDSEAFAGSLNLPLQTSNRSF